MIMPNVVTMLEALDEAEERGNEDRVKLIRAKIAEARLTALALLPMYAECTLDNYQIATGVEGRRQKQVVDKLRDYIAHLPQAVAHGVSVVLSGSCGAGKDHLLSAMARMAAREMYHVETWTGAQIAMGSRQSMHDGDESDWLQQLLAPDILYISDPYQTRGDGAVVALTDFQLQWFYQIVDMRTAMKKPIWLSINASSRDEIGAALNSRIADRLFNNCIALQCSWPSYRKPFSGDWSSLPPAPPRPKKQKREYAPMPLTPTPKGSAGPGGAYKPFPAVRVLGKSNN